VGQSWAGRKLALIFLGALVYALVVEISPLLHHYFECHLKTPAHCGACTQGPGVSGLETGFSLERPLFDDLGRVESRPIVLAAPGATQDRIGRAPPV
jgi:hypothetical protein